MKRILLLLMTVLLAFAVCMALAEEPEGVPAEPAAEEPAAEEPAAEEPAAEVPAEEPAEQPAEVPAEQPAEEPGETPAEPAAEEPAGEPAEQSAEEAQAGEFPADAACTHDHTETVYYFDAPDYRPMNDDNHLVIGQAMVEVSCLDCGAVLSVSMEDNAEEVRPHVFRDGRCVLCGREGAAEKALPASRETLVSLEPAGDPDTYYCILKSDDLQDVGDTLVLRPEGRDTALAVQTEALLGELDRTGGSFSVELRKPGDRDIGATVCLFDEYGEVVVPETHGFSLRIYAGNSGAPLTVSFTNPHGASSSEEARWVKNNGDEGYWIVTWLGDGLYEYR